ncbi:HAMP domain-containing histidine kinase [bacterium]|nr:HAMP domain-containing histidine kinase [bacterium]
MICGNPNRAKKTRSIFLRLLFVLLATMGLIHLVIGAAFGLLSVIGSGPAIEDNIKHYANMIIDEIGVPPDTVRARELAETYQIYIQYEGENFKWVSHEDVPKIFRGFGPSAKWRKPVVISNKDGSQYTLKWRFGPFRGIQRQMLLIVLLIVTVIFIGAHGYLRRILQPIQWLKKGVDEIKNGHFNVEIPKIRNDELGRLTEAFNSMVQQIKQMIRSRDQLLLDVSHEMRSPLTRIKVALEFIQDGEKKTAILSDITEIETMMTEILETERLQTEHGKMNNTPTDLASLVRETARQFKTLPPGIRLVDIPQSLLISIDAERIHMVLKNIFENSVKFSQHDSQPVEVSMTVEEEKVILRIRDDGIGVPEDQVSYVFEPFFRVDRSRSKKSGGYGLGLHLCQKIMEAHNGEIRIENNKKKRGVTLVLIFCR